jgi:SAM-dependent methyltransferase
MPSIREGAAELQFSTVISPKDHMWNTGSQWYYDVGKSALDCIRSALATARIKPASILDLPSGHGRVCRMLRAAFPEAHLTVCDLDHDAVDFCAAQFNAVPVYSHEDIRRVRLDQSFDLIWCGSLLTHLDRQQWPDFLGFFSDHLSPDGLLVHHPRTAAHSVDARGFF